MSGPPAAATPALRRAVLLLFALLLLLRLAAATRLELFGDEAFYWLCAQHPAPAYADHPFMTAMSVRLGTALFGDTPLGVRAPFLLFGALLPWAVFALARPVVGSRDAWLAAGASVALPLLAIVGAVAVPDVPLLLLAAGTALGFERATRTGRPGAWLFAGACAGLGMCTHYRFVLVLGGAGGYLLLTRQGRSTWRTPGPWLASALAAAGLLPLLLFNLQLHWQPLLYQSEGRHAATDGPIAWLLHPLQQAAVVTPLLYAALLVALWRAATAARTGDHRRALLAWFALVPLGTYWVMAPFSDTGHDFVHWPAVGYLPLLPLLPGVLRDWASRGRAGLVAARLAPALGLGVALLVFVDVATGVPGLRSLHGPFDGWDELAAAARMRLPATTSDAAIARGRAAPGGGAPGGGALVLADNYIAASELQFRLGADADVYVARHPLNARHGRELQFQLWAHDEAAFRTRGGEPALIVEEVTEKPRPSTREAWEARLASLMDEVQPQGSLEIRSGRRRFRFETGRVREATDTAPALPPEARPPH